jgi:hypothetical protein
MMPLNARSLAGEEECQGDLLSMDDMWSGRVAYLLPWHDAGYVVDVDERPKACVTVFSIQVS